VKTNLNNDQFIAFTTDGWTSINNDSFVAVTVHFIDITQYVLKQNIQHNAKRSNLKSYPYSNC